MAPAGRGASPEGERIALPAVRVGDPGRGSRSSFRRGDRRAAGRRLDGGGDRRAGGCARPVDQAACGARDVGGADRASRLRAAPGAAWRRWQHRNGSTAKTLATEHGPVDVRTPRDRKGRFEPQIVRKGQRRFEGFDDKILTLYSRGLSTRDIEAHLAEIYGVQVGRDLISRVTDAVMDDVREWQQRPLDDVYPVVFLDALVLKIP
jgi:hypothetical protein